MHSLAVCCSMLCSRRIMKEVELRSSQYLFLPYSWRSGQRKGAYSALTSPAPLSDTGSTPKMTPHAAVFIICHYNDMNALVMCFQDNLQSRLQSSICFFARDFKMRERYPAFRPSSYRIFIAAQKRPRRSSICPAPNGIAKSTHLAQRMHHPTNLRTRLTSPHRQRSTSAAAFGFK